MGAGYGCDVDMFNFSEFEYNLEHRRIGRTDVIGKRYIYDETLVLLVGVMHGNRNDPQGCLESHLKSGAPRFIRE